MKLEPRHIEALIEAESWIFVSDLCPHIELKELLLSNTPQAHIRFRHLFTKIYGLNMGGLTKPLMDKYFEILFSEQIYTDSGGQVDYYRILRTLYNFKRKQKDNALHFSFVSKLVAIHQDSSPLYDRHVLAFFRKKAPAKSVGFRNRIDWYIDFLDYVRSSYIEWGKDKRIKALLMKIKERDSRLKKFDTVRLMDFLVWTVGNRNLLKK